MPACTESIHTLEHSNSLTPLRSDSHTSGRFSVDDSIEESPETNHRHHEKHRPWRPALTFMRKWWPFLCVVAILLALNIIIIIPFSVEIANLKKRIAKQCETTAASPAGPREEWTGTDDRVTGGTTEAGLSLESLQQTVKDQSAVIEAMKATLIEVSSNLAMTQEQLLNQSRKMDANLSMTQQQLLNQSRKVEILESQMNGSRLSLQDLIQNQSRQLGTLDTELKESSAVLGNVSTQMASLHERVNRVENQATDVNFTVEDVEKWMKDLDSRMSSARGDVNQTLVKVSNLTQELRQLTRATIYRSCKDYQDRGFTTSGVYKLVLTNTMFNVFCDMDTDGGGWLVFQRRQDGSENFYRNWTEYQRGFGSLQGEFWLGNEKLKELTSSGTMRLRVDMEDWAGNRKWAEYSSFTVAPSNQRYTLRVSGYRGTAGDALSYNNGQGFSTFDVDHDDRHDSCAQSHHGAFWYKSCHLANPNGRYGNARDWSHVVWETNFLQQPTTALKAIQMKLR